MKKGIGWTWCPKGEWSSSGAPHEAEGQIPAVRARCQPYRSIRDETPLDSALGKRTRTWKLRLLIVKASRELAWLPPGPLTGHARARHGAATRHVELDAANGMHRT